MNRLYHHFPSRLCLWCWVFVGLLCWGGAERIAWAQKTPEQLFLNARNSFHFGAYKKSIELFRALLYPKPGKLRDEILQRKAHKFLGISYFHSGKFENARRELLQYLFLDPSALFDEALYPPNLVSFFNKLRKEYKQILDELVRKQKQKRPAPPIQVLQLRVDRRIVKNNPLIALLPFGVPQFVNQQPIKASILLSAEVATLGLNIGTYLTLLSMQNTSELSPQRGRFEDPNTARTLQIMQYVSFGIFAGLLVYGWIDGFLFVARENESLLPQIPQLDTRQFRHGTTTARRSSTLLFSSP